jgi:hypothetical protein
LEVKEVLRRGNGGGGGYREPVKRRCGGTEVYGGFEVKEDEGGLVNIMQILPGIL